MPAGTLSGERHFRRTGRYAGAVERHASAGEYCAIDGLNQLPGEFSRNLNMKNRSLRYEAGA
jgi:hypothetical protein